jgi:uncharacterized membrane protein YfcA
VLATLCCVGVLGVGNKLSEAVKRSPGLELLTPDTVVLETGSHPVVVNNGDTAVTPSGNDVTVSTNKLADGGEKTEVVVHKSQSPSAQAKPISDEKITIDTANGQVAVQDQSDSTETSGSEADKSTDDVENIFERDSYGDNCESEFERQQCDGLYCNSATSTCDYCTQDSDCSTRQYYCSPSKHGSMFALAMPSCGEYDGAHQGCLCYHKQLFPIDHADIYGATFTLVASTIAALAGIGGGGLLVPLYVLVMNFEADYASPLSSAAIMGGSIVGFVIYCQRWHERYPAIQRPLIDYETTALLIPALLAGVMIGTILDKLLPIWAILAIMFILLITTTIRTGGKAYRLCVEDTENVVNETYATEKCAALEKREEGKAVPTKFEGVFRHDTHYGGKDEKDDNHEGDAASCALPAGDDDGVDDPSPPYESIPDNPTMNDLNRRECNPGEVEAMSDFSGDKLLDKEPLGAAFGTPLDESTTGIHAHPKISQVQVMDKMGEPLLSKTGDLLEGKHELLEGKPLLADPASPALMDAAGDSGEVVQAAVPITGTRFPGRLMGFIFLVWVTVIAIAVLKGGSRLQSPLPFVSCNDGGYWGVLGVGLIILGLLQIWIRHLILYSSSSTQADIHWNRKNTLTVPLVSLPAGLIASLCGIGGGMVIGPILLELGARVSSVPATSTFVVLVTASSSTIQFVLTGNLPFFYAITFATLGGSGTLMGIYMQDFILKRSENANFVIVLVITTILIASTGLMGYSGIRNVIRLSEMEGANFGLRNLCH